MLLLRLRRGDTGFQRPLPANTHALACAADRHRRVHTPQRQDGIQEHAGDILPPSHIPHIPTVMEQKAALLCATLERQN